MNIGRLAETCNCPIETIRYYEKIGLLPTPDRAINGYRVYDDQSVKWLQFILRSRSLGFSQEEVRRLASMAHQQQPACAEVHDLLAHHVNDVRVKLKLAS